MGTLLYADDIVLLDLTPKGLCQSVGPLEFQCGGEDKTSEAREKVPEVSSDIRALLPFRNISGTPVAVQLGGGDEG
ncbi:hypothetical protein NDU88_003881 [Pleurodeles waltl]|uniref:Reverse transcriptase domain-containing protein n=1 Tax=Pleurodeles waltl TaxID=8319 RepID=A0AAV7M6N6_PLEWA|nr:hypothetical protein NDU88_003881 [Pleurodeles waltl]